MSHVQVDDDSRPLTDMEPTTIAAESSQNKTLMSNSETELPETEMKLPSIAFSDAFTLPSTVLQPSTAFVKLLDAALQPLHSIKMKLGSGLKAAHVAARPDRRPSISTTAIPRRSLHISMSSNSTMQADEQSRHSLDMTTQTFMTNRTQERAQATQATTAAAQGKIKTKSPESPGTDRAAAYRARNRRIHHRHGPYMTNIRSQTMSTASKFADGAHNWPQDMEPPATQMARLPATGPMSPKMPPRRALPGARWAREGTTTAPPPILLHPHSAVSARAVAVGTHGNGPMGSYARAAGTKKSVF